MRRTVSFDGGGAALMAEVPHLMAEVPHLLSVPNGLADWDETKVKGSGSKKEALSNGCVDGSC